MLFKLIGFLFVRFLFLSMLFLFLYVISGRTTFNMLAGFSFLALIWLCNAGLKKLASNNI
jgi:hypothetical protein